MVFVKEISITAVAVLCCFAFGSAAVASDTDGVKKSTALSVQNRTTSSSKEGSSDILLNQYLVTADKMNTDVQSLPSSVNVLSAEDMEDYNITSTKDIFATAPNMFYTKSGNDAYVGDSFVSVRGITSFMSGSPVLGVYVDDVYIPGYEIPLFDIEKTEVLRGPQATLYGRNSQGGIISIYTKQPNSVEWEGKLSQTLGNYNTAITTGILSGPINDDWSVRAAGQYEYTDGFSENYDGSNDVNQHRNWSAQGTADWHPRDDLKLTLNVDGQDYDGKNAEYIKYSDLKSDPHDVSVDWPGKATKLAGGMSGKLEYKFNDMKLLSISALRHTNSESDMDMDFTNQDITRYFIADSNNLITQEFRLQSDDGNESNLQWLVGSFLFNEKDDLSFRYLAGADDPYGMAGESYRQKGETDSKGFAFFGQGVYTLGQVDITLGLRYDYESKSFDYDQEASKGMGMDNFSGSSSSSSGTFLPKAAVGWHINDNIMPYFSVSRGYRGGGFNLSQSAGKAYDPEYTWNYEAGVKTTWLDKTLKLNLAAFYIDWTDIQVLQPSFPEFSINNGGNAVSEGFEIDAAWRPIESLELFANAGYTHAYFTKYSDASGDYSNKNVTNVPEYTASTGATYRFLDHFMVSADYTAVGPLYYDTENTVRQSMYNLVNAKIGYESEYFEAYIWGKNLLDEKYSTRAFDMGGEWYARAGDPLTVGTTLTCKF
ncbi:TonB-dependent receptor [Desulfovibrio sp. UCD-KL4C]|uniref:TonB-dependent receptor n=1 Tax=Desulfovibrio sp. UCD-KL4C TaxID=2578120 RepID=UPI0025C1581F|nr:TonB-dependent receptor [Desulfovibrio sp. UCD-KL4C]